MYEYIEMYEYWNLKHNNDKKIIENFNNNIIQITYLQKKNIKKMK